MVIGQVYIDQVSTHSTITMSASSKATDPEEIATVIGHFSERSFVWRVRKSVSK